MICIKYILFKCFQHPVKLKHTIIKIIICKTTLNKVLPQSFYKSFFFFRCFSRNLSVFKLFSYIHLVSYSSYLIVYSSQDLYA